MTPKDFSNMIPSLKTKIEAAVQETVIHAGTLVADEAKAMIGRENEEWPALADSTIARKASEGFPTPAPLKRTGELQASIKSEISPHLATIGSDDPDAAVHEHGNSHVPPRPFLVPAAYKKAPEIRKELERRLQMAFGGRNV